MHEAMARWKPGDWNKTWPGEDDNEPEIITRVWVIWHLIEHDLHHGDEISITLGLHGISAIELLSEAGLRILQPPDLRPSPIDILGASFFSLSLSSTFDARSRGDICNARVRIDR